MTRHTQVVVIGGGPAGMAAATAAATSGATVTLLDDNPGLGGQIWRTGIASTASAKETRTKDRPRKKALEALEASGAVRLYGRRVVDATLGGALRVLVEERQTIETFTWEKLILATGARERFLPFPGWTLPGVFGAGGLQALVKGGYSVAGRRVAVAGTGPLLLAVAAHLKQDGAKLVSVTEQAGLASMLRFATKLSSHPAKLLQGARYRIDFGATPYSTGCWPVAAEGDEKVTGVRLTDGKKTWTQPCDLLACGFHLVPNTELAALLGCKLVDDFVAVDAHQQTSVANIYCVGESSAIAGLDAALVQGRIAGLTAAGKANEAAALHGTRDRERAFGRDLEQAFALRPELRSLAAPDTIVCRCEDVSYAQLRSHTSWTDAKLQTRCGMGRCQGRICGPALQTLFGWKNSSVRPPLFPVPLSAMILTEAQSTTGSTSPQETR